MMENNPYQAPQAQVSDGKGGAPVVRPAAIIVALTLLWASMAIGLLFWANAFHAMQSGEMSAIQWLAQLIGLLVTAFLIVMIGRGRNWARIVFMVLMLLGIAFSGYVLRRLYYVSPNDLLALAVPPAFNLVAMFVVFVPGREWFRRA